MATGIKRYHRVEQSLVPTSYDFKASSLYLPCFRAIVRGDVPLAAIAEPERLFEKSFIGGISAVHYGHDCNTISYRPH